MSAHRYAPGTSGLLPIPDTLWGRTKWCRQLSSRAHSCAPSTPRRQGSASKLRASGVRRIRQGNSGRNREGCPARMTALGAESFPWVASPDAQRRSHFAGGLEQRVKAVCCRSPGLPLWAGPCRSYTQ